MNTKIEIALSKNKIMGLFAGAMAFVISGILFSIYPDNFISPFMRNPEIIRITGITAISFFGLCLVFITRKLFDSKPGLMINEYGITDNTNATSVGLIDWVDITGIEGKQVMSSSFLILYIKKPEKYISRARNVVVKKAMEVNNECYGSPIAIMSNSLKIDFNKLEKLIRVEFENRNS